MQLIIEYMLNAQNAQLNTIIDKSHHIKSLMNTIKKLETDKMKLKGNLKTANHNVVSTSKLWHVHTVVSCDIIILYL